MKHLLKEINVSKNFENYSQRNNEILPSVACGPTNMIQALEYSGWHWNNNIIPELKQPEDKLMKFTRTNETVLKYYETKYRNMFRNWQDEAKKLKKSDEELWQVNCKEAYAPNEVHDVMNFATNLFLGYTEKDIENKDYATHFVSEFNERCVLKELSEGCPVVSSVRFGGCGHYITIVGVQWHDELIPDNVENYIIDNTYGKFNFKTETYEKVSGNDNIIPREELLARVRPAMHLFIKGAETI